MWWSVQIGKFCSKLRYFKDRNIPKEEIHENEFWLFSNNKLNVSNIHEKEKVRSFLLFSSFLHELSSLNCTKKNTFLQFYADFRKKPKSVKAIYIFQMKILITLFQKMIMRKKYMKKWLKKQKNVFMTPSCVMVLKLHKHFLQFCPDFSKKPKSVKAIYILHLKVFIILFHKMILFVGKS